MWRGRRSVSDRAWVVEGSARHVQHERVPWLDPRGESGRPIPASEGNYVASRRLFGLEVRSHVGSAVHILREPLDPALLKRPALVIRFDGVRAVVRPHPVHSPGLGHAGKHRHARKNGSRATCASGASDLHMLTPVRAIERSAYLGDGLFEASRHSEVLPLDDLRGPGGRPSLVGIEPELSPLIILASVGQRGGTDECAIGKLNFLCHP
jgi:hypothetical protein